MKKVSNLIGLGSFLFFAFVAKQDAVFYIPTGWPEPVYDFGENKLTPEKIVLGRVVFYDEILSRNNTISCASCHSPYNAFTHVDHDLSHGVDDRIGTRNSPALMNLAWHKAFMWDGAIHNLDVQALAPIHHHDEMDSRIEDVVMRLQKSYLYPPLFFQAYGDSSVTGERTLKAISQFLLTLVSNNSKYDKMKRGELRFTEQEQKGYAIFKTNCASCHSEPLFMNNQFANNGLPIDTSLNDFGRLKITNNAGDFLRFKVPSLRNIEFSYPYMHDGRFKSLNQVLNHYTSLNRSFDLDSALRKPIHLSSNDKVDLIAFLLTLSDTSFIFNKSFSFPKELLLKAKE